MKSTKLLMVDHEIILQAVHVLREIVSETEYGKEINHNDIRSLLTFFRDFADGCHHVKEEAILFPALMLAGISLQDGPLCVLSQEHARGRTLTSAMVKSLDQNEKENFLMYAHQYIKLLTEHIEKENHALFDIADRTLADEEDGKVAEDFELFDKNTVGMQARERSQSVIEGLASKYITVVV